jgi:hypothetical protein
MKRRLLPLLLIAVLGLAACGKDESTASSGAAKMAAASTTPTAAVQAQFDALKAGRFSSAFLASFPPNMVERLRQEWKTEMAEPVSEEDREKFAAMMSELTAEGAEDAIFAKIEPDLAQLQQTAALQMPMYVGMGRGILAAGVQQREDLSAEQKAQAMASIDAFAKWAETAQFAEPELAKQAIGHVCKAARDLNLKSIDDLRALDFDQMLERGDVLFAAIKGIFATYGMRFDDILASARTELVSQNGEVAKVKVNYTMFDTPLSFESELVERDGRWYGKEMLESFEKDLAEGAGKVEAPAQG